jgi:uncharacterized protein YyaL (SSP411 family)
MLKNYSRQLSFLTVLFLLLNSCAENESTIHRNNLDLERSEYLLQHSENPVHWQAWSEQVLSIAKKQQKPIIISIGYSSCHWCHVMERESFSDDEVANLMNQHFISIKVDREEKPDIDFYYLTTAQLITGSPAGWPLNIIATPEGEAFYAGTYHSKEEWIEVLNKTINQLEKNKDRLFDYARMVKEGVINETQPIEVADNSELLDKEELKSSLETWMLEWDVDYGGIQAKEKFVNPPQIEFLLDYYELNPSAEVKDFIVSTLKKIARSGLIDPLSGGAFRYSTDDKWHIPHFEKMLYDNGQLLKLYSRAYLKYNEPLFLETASLISKYLFETLKLDSELFSASQNAESEGREGYYYLFSKEEFEEELLNKITRFEFDSDSFHLPAQPLSNSIMETLNEIRASKIAPEIDHKVIISWNALTIEGLFYYYLASGEKAILKQAKASLNAALSDSKSLRHVAGDPSSNAVLEDYAFLAKTALTAYQITGERYYLEAAIELADEAIDRFEMSESPLFANSPKNLSSGVPRIINSSDGVLPNPNAILSSTLYDLSHITGVESYKKRHEAMVMAIQPWVSESMGFFPSWANNLLHNQHPFYEVVVMGEEAKSFAEELLIKQFANTLTLQSSEESEESPLFKNRFVADETLIYICIDNTCLQPLSDIQEAKDFLTKRQ